MSTYEYGLRLSRNGIIFHLCRKMYRLECVVTHVACRISMRKRTAENRAYSISPYTHTHKIPHRVQFIRHTHEYTIHDADATYWFKDYIQYIAKYHSSVPLQMFELAFARMKWVRMPCSYAHIIIIIIICIILPGKLSSRSYWTIENSRHDTHK